MANAELAELGMLCAAFKRANPGSVLDLLVDGDNKFNGFTIVPGSHVHVLPAVLNIVCADAYHMKVLIFNNQLLAVAVLTQPLRL